MKKMSVRFVKRGEINKKQKAMIKLLAIVLAFVTSGVFLMALNHNPLSVYGAMMKGAFGTQLGFRQTIVKAIPLAITALGLTVAYKMKFWNIGGEGQIMMGAFGAALIALKFSNLPKAVMLPAMFLSGMFFAGLWALVPAFFRAKWRVNETIITLMMNYIALKFITYLQYGPWKDAEAFGFPKIPNFGDNALLPKVFKINIGWIIAIILCIIIYLFLNRTKKGFEISVLGESQKTAVYAAIDIKKTILQAVFISGIICGATGVIQASGVSETLSVEVSGGVGNTAIIVAWLSVLNPFAIMIVSVLFAALVQGGVFAQSLFGIPDSVALIIQSMILFFVLGSEIFTNYSLKFKRSTVNKSASREVA